ncbi:MAG: amidase [Paracoccus sp. (in: a-proteobacteria)]|uniref:amidase n=1 Tax=Paracoccus sp. TaxID=267 RepID=UPI00391ABCC8
MSLTDLTIAEASDLIARKALSPLDYVDGLLDHVARVGPALDAFVSLDRDALRDGARRATAEIAARGPRSALHGIPFGAKDIIDVAGSVTTCHSRIAPDRPAGADAACVANLRAAGALPMGKLATLEFALGGPSFDLPYPPARNPWDRERFTGGSSSGSGAAVAGRMMPAALGSDTGGSIRNPAATCGLVGLKPTFGLVPVEGVFPLAPTLDHIGPMTRTVRDNALMLEGLTAAPGRYTAALNQPLRGRRIGYIRHFHTEDHIAHPDFTDALDAAVAVMRAEGAEVTEVRFMPLRVLDAVLGTIMYSEAATVHQQWLQTRPGDYGQITRERLMAGMFLGATDYLQAQRQRMAIRRLLDQVLAPFDVLICANAMDPASRLDDQQDVDFTFPRQARRAFNMTGHPVLAVMAGLSAQDRLPLSMQLIGRHGDEASLYSVAAGYERATGWPAHRPDLERLAHWTASARAAA